VKQQVLDFIRQPGELEPLALELFRWQRDHSRTWARFAGRADPQALHEIPAVPVSLLKQVTFSCVDQPSVVFRTSGTTRGVRGEHWMPDTDVYDLAAQTWFDACVQAPLACVSLITDAPDSSLGHMVARLRPRRVVCFPEVSEAARTISLQPVFLCATAFALADFLKLEVRLPARSVVMVTGGFKGRQTAVTREQLLFDAHRILGEVQLVEEYGMTELSSQLWDTDGLGFKPPPWLHVYTVDPITGRPVDGQGLLRFVDLANWASVLAIETEDVGRIDDDGRVHLVGRLPSSAPRGCSLSWEERV